MPPHPTERKRRIAWEEKSTETHSMWVRLCAFAERQWNNVTQPKTKVRPFKPVQDLPHISGVKPSDRSFEDLYRLEKKLRSHQNQRVHRGFRRLDGKQVLVKLIDKSRPEQLLDVPGYSTPLSQEAAVMLQLQKSPTRDYIVQLHDLFVNDDQDILVMEYPRSNTMSLLEYFIQQRCRLSEDKMRRIIVRVIVALQHCMDQGVYHGTQMKNIVIDQRTLQVKLVDFSNALLIGEQRDDEPMFITAIRKCAVWGLSDDVCKLMDVMVPGMCRGFRRTICVSKESLDLLEKLHDSQSQMPLRDILLHDWFKNPS